MDVDRPWPLRKEIGGVEYVISFIWASPATDTPNKVTVCRGLDVLYHADIQAVS